MDKKIPDGVVLTAAYALCREWNLHYPDAVRMAALVLSVGQQHPERQPEAWITPGGDVSRSFQWCLERCLPGQQPRPLYAAQQPASSQVDVRKFLTLVEQWERYADGCRPYGFIKEAELLEYCAQCIRQTLGISADTGESSLVLPGCDPLVEKLLSIAIKDKEKERITARAEQSAAVDEAMKNLRDAILRNDGLTRKNTLAAFWAVEDALAAQQRGEVT